METYSYSQEAAGKVIKITCVKNCNCDAESNFVMLFNGILLLIQFIFTTNHMRILFNL